MMKKVVFDTLSHDQGWRRKTQPHSVGLDEVGHPPARGLCPEDELRLKVLLENRPDELMAQLPSDHQPIVPLLRDGLEVMKIARRLGIAHQRVSEVKRWLLEKALE